MSQSDPSATTGREQTLDARDYLRPIWQRKWLVALIVVIAAAGTYAIAAHRQASPQPRLYSANAQVYIEVADPTNLVGANAAASPPSGEQMANIATLVTAQAIGVDAYKRLGLRLGSAGSVTAAPLATGAAAQFGSSILVVTATSRSPTLAARLANAYVTAFLASRGADEAGAAQAEISTTRAELAGIPDTTTNAGERGTLLVQIAQLQAQARYPSSGARVINPATVPTTPLPVATRLSPAVEALIGGVVGLLLGIGLVVALSTFDRRFTRISSVASTYGQPVLAVLPRVSDRSPVVAGRAVVAPALVEVLRSLRVTLQLTSGGVPPRTVLITSALQGEGKSTLARDLALTYAAAGERVLLLDADLRRPTVPRFFDLKPTYGLTHILRGDASFADAVVPVQVQHEPHLSGNGNRGAARSIHPRPGGSLAVLAHGDLLDDPSTLLASSRLRDVIGMARARYDVVVIDTAPVLAVSDAVLMFDVVDAVLLVMRLGKTPRDAAERLMETVSRVRNAHIAGVVVNDLREKFLGGGYYGGYGGYSGGYADRRRKPTC